MIKHLCLISCFVLCKELGKVNYAFISVGGDLSVDYSHCNGPPTIAVGDLCTIICLCTVSMVQIFLCSSGWCFSSGTPGLSTFGWGQS